MAAEDLIVGYHFSISFVGGTLAGENAALFRECSGLEVRYDVLTYHEGGNNASPHQLLGAVHYPNLVLSYGMTQTAALVTWLERNMTEPERAELILTARGSQFSAERKWNVVEAFPVEWNGGSFSADSASIVIESLTIAHSGLKPAD